MLARALVFTCLLACGSTPVPAKPEPEPETPKPTPTPLATAAPTTTAPAVPTSTATGAPAPAKFARLAVTFAREVDAPVRAIALDRAPFAAALGEQKLFTHEGKAWVSRALPASAAGAGPLDLFYGRDTKVRIVGTRAGATGPEGVYLRDRAGKIGPDRAEIGTLGSPKGALVAVLGPEDPEVLCRPGGVCIAKRRTGWTTFDAPAVITLVARGGDVAWGVSETQLLKLAPKAKTWETQREPGPWKAATSLFAFADRAWVLEAGADRVHAFDGARWSTSASPIAGPRAMWGARPDALWLVGDGGLAFFDGKIWSVADADIAPAKLALVLGRDERDVWVGGAGGVHRVVR